MSRVIVIGAGMSGLAAAYRLQQDGHEVVVLERNAVPGGSARSERHGGYLIDTGPDALNTSYVRLLGLARDAGLGEAIVASSSSMEVIRAGRPVGFDGSHPASLLFIPLLSNRGRAGMVFGYLRTRKKIKNLDPYDLTRYAAEGNQPAKEFAHNTFGAEFADRFLDPIVRVFAGTGLNQSNALSVLGALSVGACDLVNIVGGLQAIPTAVARHLDTRCGVTVNAVTETADGVTVSTDGESLRADACLLAVMYEEAAQLWPALTQASPGFGDSLRPIPLISISLGYDTAAATRAYTILVPTAEQPDALLAFMQQHKAPDRAPAGHSLVTLYTEALATPRYIDRTDSEITTWADDLVTDWYPELAGHRDLSVITRWERTGYVPTPGFFERSRELRKALPQGRIQATSTLFGSGSLERAVLGGERAAARLAAGLS
jgi:protoporphyrinogen/coproporphyrinogen III oxidase